MVSKWIVFRLLQNIHSFCSSLFWNFTGFFQRHITQFSMASHRFPVNRQTKASTSTPTVAAHQKPALWLNWYLSCTQPLLLCRCCHSKLNICFWNYFNLISCQALQYVQKSILIKTKTMKVKGRRTNRILKVSWPLITSQGYLHDGCTS